MKTQLKLTALAAATGLAFVSSANAATVTVPASVIVNSAINMTVNSNLDFGTVAAFLDDSGGATTSTLTLSANPATAPVVTWSVDNTTADIIPLAPGAPADISVTGAAPGYVLTVTLPAAAGILKDPSVPAGMEFILNGFTKHAYLEGDGTTFGTKTDASGNFSFYVGAAITTSNTVAPTVGAGTAKAPYNDATYTGTFDVVVEY